MVTHLSTKARTPQWTHLTLGHPQPTHMVLTWLQVTKNSRRLGAGLLVKFPDGITQPEPAPDWLSPGSGRDRHQPVTPPRPSDSITPSQP